MSKEKRIRVLVSKVGLDGSDKGIQKVATLLKKAGMEVIYLGTYQTPEGIVRAALDEDADVIGLSYLSGGHLTFTPKIVAEMKKNEMDDVLLIAGGSFPAEDIPAMEAMGMDKVFGADSPTHTIVSYINDHARR
jgi:methylmalonyl-CoA mutase C-terminal domain/subunit